MATTFPTTIDTLTNPASTDTLDSPSHADQHINSNDAIEALEAKVGVDSSAVATSLDYKVNTARTGSDTNIVTGTKGTSGDLSQWNGDGDLVDGPTPPSGTIVGTSDTQTLTNKTLTSPAINTPTVTSPIVRNWDGWMDANEAWTYASATTITVPTGAASKYQKGDKIKLTQTTVKYFYIISVADTVLTITGGSSYTLTNAAISANYYSKIDNPHGFPAFFAYTPVISSVSTASTYSSSTGRFSISNGGIVQVNIQLNNTTGGTAGSGAEVLQCSMPVADYANMSAIGFGTTYEATGTLGAVICRRLGDSKFYFHLYNYVNVVANDQSSEERQLHFNLTYEMA